MADYSQGKPDLSTQNLLVEIPPWTGHSGGSFFAMNLSTVPLTLAIDDGSGGDVTVFVLDPASAAGRQGGSMGSADVGMHQGRIRLYGPAGSAFALRTQ